MLAQETWIELLKDPDHIAFEIILNVIQFVIVGLIARPIIRHAVALHDERKHKHEHCVPECETDYSTVDLKPWKPGEMGPIS